MEGFILLIGITWSLFYIFACLKVLNETEPSNNKALVRIGSKLVIGSGLLLAGLQAVAKWLERPTDRETLCGIYFEGKVTITGIENYKCEELLQNVWGKVPEWTALLVIDAFSWVIPLVFAAVGVNTISHGLINNHVPTRSEENRTKLLKPVLWLHKKFVSMVEKNL
ncbi:hypothetical protein CRN32_06230 [Vibrio vulnificus]|uniref:hypothetical protein n=1 Tax=Vibrio vulnificus TaxID=672 RepID=UPI000CD0706C|nr:hypothetical protein [Vibrio vulnificus]POC57376.1 hypothetical protein CRN32_06230 [Vibrio vulnificus]